MGFRVFEQKDEGWETENVELPKRGINLRFPFLEKDTSIYELQKFLKMIRKKNPNIIDLLESIMQEIFFSIHGQTIKTML